MSTFTRTTTPPYSANPLQVFVTYKQARRAAKGGGPVALLMAALVGLSLLPVLATAEFAYLSAPKKAALLIISGAMIFGLLWLGWRIWLRPGPWKVTPILVFLLLDGVAEALRFSMLGLIIVGVSLNFSVIAFRGALAMKRLQDHAGTHPDIDVF